MPRPDGRNDKEVEVSVHPIQARPTGRSSRRRLAGVAAATGLALVLAACAPGNGGTAGTAGSGAGGATSGAAGGGSSPSAGGAAASSVASSAAAPSSPAGSSAAASSASSFDLDALVAAAKKEGSVTVYADSGQIVDIAKAFSAKYGIKATGVKSKTADTVQKITRLAQAGNVSVDVALIDDAPVVAAQLEPQNITENWVPPDFAGTIKAGYTDPLDPWLSPDYFVYNAQAYPNGCPIKNVWDLTKPEWKGKLAMEDVGTKSDFINFFAQLTLYGTDQLTQAYQQEFGKAPTLTEKNIAWQWIKGVLQNDPILSASEDDAADAVGAPGQKNPPVGLMSPSKLSDNKDKGYHLAVCDGMTPWVGFEHLVIATIVKGTPHPNAAKLFIHYLMTDGVDPVIDEGKISTNSEVKTPSDSLVDPSKYQSDLFILQASNDALSKTWALRQQMQDFIAENKTS